MEKTPSPVSRLEIIRLINPDKMTLPDAISVVCSIERFNSNSSPSIKPVSKSPAKNIKSMDMPPIEVTMIRLAITAMINPFILPNFKR